MTQYHLSSALADHDLVELIRQPHDAALADSAFRELERRYLKRFQAEIRKNPLLARDPENAVQEMRLALLRAARRFSAKQGTKFSTYVRHDLRGAVATALRQGPQYKTLDEIQEPEAPDDLSEVDQSQIVQSLMATLSEREQAVLVDLAIAHSVSEIARWRQLAKSTVSETVARIRRKAFEAGLVPATA